MNTINRHRLAAALSVALMFFADEAAYAQQLPAPVVQQDASEAGAEDAETPTGAEARVVAQGSPDPCAEIRAQAAQFEARLQDWPALSRYGETNAKLAPPAKGELRVVFLGDSITDSWDEPRFGGFFPGRPYVNRGIGGQTTPQMLLRFRQDVIALKPEVVVILAGTNDIAGNTGPVTPESIQDNLTSMVERARTHGIRVVLASVLPVSDYDETGDGKTIIRTARRPPEQIKTLNAWMRSYAAESALIYLDYYSPMADERGFLKDELSDDGLHPNEKGYAVMAPLAEQAIVAALKKKK